MKYYVYAVILPGLLAVVGLAAIVWLATLGPQVEVLARVPGLDDAPPREPGKGLTRPVPGEPTAGAGRPSALRGAWPWFRGERLDARSPATGLARQWPADGPKRLWEIPVAEGYAGAAVRDGRVFLLDYDAQHAADTIRCLSLDDGREIWRNGYHVEIAPNHGITRTVPAVIGDVVVSFGPKCHVVGWEAATGKALWLLDLVLDYGATVPDWYAGQCPLYDAQLDHLVLAPGGRALLIAVDYKTGKVKWESPNPRKWNMTHTSIAPMELDGRRMYVYSGSGGVAGVAADNGAILWETTAWQIPTAACASPLPIGDGRVFLCGGYNAGAMMLRIASGGGKFSVETLYKLTPGQFSSEQQTPILLDGYLYGVRQKDKQLVCLDLAGKERWNSGREKFGAAPYLIADGLVIAMNDTGTLSLVEASPNPPYRRLAKAQLFADGVDAWGPMALVEGRLLARDMTRLACFDLRTAAAGTLRNSVRKGDSPIFVRRFASLTRKSGQSPSVVQPPTAEN